MFSLFRQGLKKVSQGIQAVFNKIGDRPSAQTLEELEATLLQADLGPGATAAIVKELQGTRQSGRTPGEIAKEILSQRLEGIERPLKLEAGLQTILIAGINGAGKTTTVAKLAAAFKAQGRKPIIASADTFRAAANEQLAMWAQRAGVPLIESKSGGDPAAVAFDALSAAKTRGHDVLIIDTAGRLHTKEGLMTELQKIEKVLKKIDPAAPQHCWLVLDGSLGLNNLSQAEAFAKIINVTGLIITKLDGSAKAGFLVPLYEKLKLPVVWVGLGEKMEELQPFDKESYLEGLLTGDK